MYGHRPLPARCRQVHSLPELRRLRRNHRYGADHRRGLSRRCGMEASRPYEVHGGDVKLSCADYAFPLLPHDDTLGLIATLEFSGVDIGLFENRSHLWPSKEFPQLNARARELRCKLQERDLKPADVFLQMDLDIVPYAINRPEA